MIIIAGRLHVDPEAREQYLAACLDATTQARAAPGCLDFVQAADPIEPDRINVYERWESDADLHAFRGDGSGSGSGDLPPVRDASVSKYRISATEAP